jgi:hypothetical protein
MEEIVVKGRIHPSSDKSHTIPNNDIYRLLKTGYEYVTVVPYDFNENQWGL